MNNCISIILLLLTLSTNVLCQTGKPIQSEANESTKIALSDILGDWYPIDSLVAPQITFRQMGNSLVVIDGIKHGVGNYSFIVEGDGISVNGIAANWPPYDCTLRLLNSKDLEIEFYLFLSTKTTKIIYRR
ncbi:MAG: hypothetical protein IPI46_03950 [Bacteroidetes bacterium]|nr:hypothetical protein [Bacteroidota bacterium]